MKTYIRPWSGQNSTRSDTVISRTWTWWLRSHRHCMALSARVTSPSAWTLSSSSSRRDLVEQTSLVRASLKNLNMKKLYFQDNTKLQLHTEAVYLEKKKLTNKGSLKHTSRAHRVTMTTLCTRAQLWGKHDNPVSGNHQALQKQWNRQTQSKRHKCTWEWVDIKSHAVKPHDLQWTPHHCAWPKQGETADQHCFAFNLA